MPNDVICGLLGIGPERRRIYVNHIEDLKELFKDFGWFYPPPRVDKGRKSSKTRGLTRDSVRILYVFKKLVDSTDEVTALQALYPTIKDLYAKHYGQNQGRRF